MAQLNWPAAAAHFHFEPKTEKWTRFVVKFQQGWTDTSATSGRFPNLSSGGNQRLQRAVRIIKGRLENRQLRYIFGMSREVCAESRHDAMETSSLCRGKLRHFLSTSSSASSCTFDIFTRQWARKKGGKIAMKILTREVEILLFFHWHNSENF